MGTVTVNGKPLAEHVSEQIGREAQQVRESENRFRIKRPIISRRGGNVSRARSGECLSFLGDPRTTHVLFRGIPHSILEKAPYSMSGVSILGGVEFDENTDTVRCHECGEWTKTLGFHVSKHGIAAAQYRTKHGLSARSSISTPSNRQAINRRLNQPNRQRGNVFTSQSVRRSGKQVNCADNRNYAGMRESKAMRPAVYESRNLKDKCFAQRRESALELYEALGRVPLIREMNEYISPKSGRHNLDAREIRRMFGVSPLKFLASIGVPAMPRKHRSQG